MKNLKGDLIWSGIFVLCIAAFVIGPSRDYLLELTALHPYISGFVKFFLLDTMGDLIGLRILNNKWVKPSHLFLKACVWGIIGIMITAAFSIFMGGVTEAQVQGKLPFAGYAIATAFFGSLAMNATFGPMMYIYHRFGDFIVDSIFDKSASGINSIAFAKSVDWISMVSFFWMKTCLFVWLPLHTIVFLLPPEYRVLVSAFLSILLGIIVALSKRKSKPNNIDVEAN